ncbi:hypothetical protein TRFO_33853 [Tritrichomonas foetus]|uniref:Myb-like DNA-binding domain containing protein n=1 Tax=Tritrichomonas foetus TaxID=1144522 RepID=A0A1J4JKF5_9EUKA|nr:hypothetical protein TRFO_33853 [Tritrichomonas foetus]|eukprot:OHS99624.1 hypothetical protein TRFO_33853 [Tritrichomonas foetus]
MFRDVLTPTQVLPASTTRSFRIPSIGELPLPSNQQHLFSNMNIFKIGQTLDNEISTFPNSPSTNQFDSNKIDQNSKTVHNNELLSNSQFKDMRSESPIELVSSPNCDTELPKNQSDCPKNIIPNGRTNASMKSDHCQCETLSQNSHGQHSKSSWSPQEDEKLLCCVAGRQNIDWDFVAAMCDGKHTPKQCRERWLIKLNPEVRRSPFESWEDDLIMQERQKIGNHWSLIAQLLPGRTSCSVKNRWYTVLRYRQAPAVHATTVPPKLNRLNVVSNSSMYNIGQKTQQRILDIPTLATVSGLNSQTNVQTQINRGNTLDPRVLALNSICSPDASTLATHFQMSRKILL